MDSKILLNQLWDIQSYRNDRKEPACRFQLVTGDARIEYHVCSSSVLLDYTPASKLELGKLYTINHLPLKKLDDFARVNPDVFLSDDYVSLEDDVMLTDYFLPLNNKEGECGMGVFTIQGEEKAVLKNVLTYPRSSSFQFAGLSFFHIPEAVQTEINNNSSMKALHANIRKVRSGPTLAVVLSCDTGMLVVTLARVRNTTAVNENIYLDDSCSERFRLDGYREDLGVFSRLVKVKKEMKTLANPMQRKTAVPVQPPAAAPEPAPAPAPEPVSPAPAAEPQVEEVKPEQAEQIAARAPEAPKKEEVPAAPAEEPKKRIRAKRQPVTATIGSVKSIDELIAYLGTPIPDGMTTEAMQEEVRKLRDLGVVVARRQSNLYTAATAAEKKLRDTLRGVLG